MAESPKEIVDGSMGELGPGQSQSGVTSSNVSGNAAPAVTGVQVCEKCESLNQLETMGFVLDNYADSENFETAVLEATTWCRDKKVFLIWGAWQQLMKALSELHPDSAPDQKDKDLTMRLSMMRIKVHRELYGPLWKMGHISPEGSRGVKVHSQHSTSAPEGGGGGAAPAGTSPLPVTEATLDLHHQTVG